MRKRLFLYTTLIVVGGLLSYFAVSVYVTHSNNLIFAKGAAEETARICAELYAEGADMSELADAGGSTRITVIGPDGQVLADSRPLDVSALENHLTRPEIAAASEGAPEAFVRHSDTLGADLIYYALKVETGGAAGAAESGYTSEVEENGIKAGTGGGSGYVYVRAAIPVEQIDTYLLQSLPLLVILLFLVALLCFFFARNMINRMTKPFESIETKLKTLASGEYAAGGVPRSFEEIDKITRGIDEVAQILQGSFHALRDEKAKLDYILNNIGDGLFVLDGAKNIALVNAAALEIFHAGPGVAGKNLNYLSYDKMIAAAADDCINSGKSALFELALEGHIYFAAVKRLPETPLTMVALSDVTENRENAKRREEFFANASHELKTPLTAIKGFGELATLNSKDENIRKYLSGINRETERMLSLIGDMLKLSELENMEIRAELHPVPVPLAGVVGEVSDTLTSAIEEKAICFETAGDAEVLVEQGHIYDLVKNLIENAVRYTGQNGHVSVRIEKSGGGAARLIISDDGIGISAKDQTRIFERFYRAEKSRSQRNGGTGLGLSIVKHICVLYGWKLTLKSRLGAGTEVRVEFGGE